MIYIWLLNFKFKFKSKINVEIGTHSGKALTSSPWYMFLTHTRTQFIVWHFLMSHEISKHIECFAEKKS